MVQRKAKGSKFELQAMREICALLNAIIRPKEPFLAYSKKGDEWDFARAVQSGGGHERGDIVKSPRAAKAFPFHIECKNWKDISIETIMKGGGSIFIKWITQAESDAPAGEVPIVLFRFHGFIEIFVLSPLHWDTASGELILPMLAFEHDGRRYMIVGLEAWMPHALKARPK